MGATEKDAMNQFVANRPDASSRDIWQQLEKLQEDREKNAGSYKEKQNARVMLKEVLLQHTYPRLDINVSKQMNHLLKSPFVVHPKTGRVCVPIDINNVDNFNPLEVPTIGRLVEDLNRSGDVRQTSLKDYTHYFEVHFLQPLERDTDREMQRSEGDLSF